jgi:hypothetical protein
MAFGSDFFPGDEAVSVTPALSAAEAIDAAIRALGSTPREDRPVLTDLAFVPAPKGEALELTIAWRVTFECRQPFGRWESYVHGRTGEILGRTNQYYRLNVTGNVQGEVEDLGPCDGTSVQSLPHLLVEVADTGLQDFTDENGDFEIPHDGTEDVTVRAWLRGPNVDVRRANGSFGFFHGTATPGTPLEISFDQSNSRWDERDVFLHTNRAHDFVKSFDPSFTHLDYDMLATVNSDEQWCPCNAWADPRNHEIGFCRGGSDCVNMGRLGVAVHHEYGHALTWEIYSSQGASQPPLNAHEANADILAIFLQRAPELSGWMVNECASYIRSAENDLRWPEDFYGMYFSSQILSGFHWDAWQSLLATYSQAVADSVALEAWHFGRSLGLPRHQTDQVLWTFIADDDDADLTNGTPNYDHFCEAATNHGFPCPQVASGVTIAHDPLPHTTDDTNGYRVVATIASGAGPLDPSELKVVYRVNGSPDAELLMSATPNPDEYEALIPAQHQHTEIEYYISARDLEGYSGTYPPHAPDRRNGFDVAMIYDDLEGDISGWNTMDAAASGEWEHGDPEKTLVIHGFDSTPGEGVNAWVTGLCAGHAACTLCLPTCNDVDAGSATLISPVYDVAGARQVTVKYDRYYTNDKGAAPGEDAWVVEVSNDAGGTWTTVESTNASDLAWRSHSVDVDDLFGAPQQVRLRFIASDLGSESLVEAGVDEIRVLAVYDPVNVLAGTDGIAPALSLAQNRPNPSTPPTTIRFSIPRLAEVQLAVYDVRGRLVREIARGPEAAGAHEVRWNGLDVDGAHVPAGVYFYRLTASGETITRKMTIGCLAIMLAGGASMALAEAPDVSAVAVRTSEALSDTCMCDAPPPDAPDIPCDWHGQKTWTTETGSCIPVPQCPYGCERTIEWVCVHEFGYEFWVEWDEWTSGCGPPVSIEKNTWGRIKAQYR